MEKKVVIIMGSKSDDKKIEGLFEVFSSFEIEYERKILSAHRTPDDLVDFVKSLNPAKTALIVAVAGGAAHLPGVVAANTIIPVIGVPIANPPHGGMDAILSIIEMPQGIPVVGVGAGSGGPANAALFAVRVLALNDQKLRARYIKYVADMRQKVLDANK